MYEPEMNPERVPATRLEANVTLLTRDGWRVGNAIIFNVVERMGTFYEIETDFGNRMVLTAHEIAEWYTLGFVVEVERWRKDRDALRSKPYGSDVPSA